MVLVSRCLEDKNESFGFGVESWSLGLNLVLVFVSILKKKSCSFSKNLL